MWATSLSHVSGRGGPGEAWWVGAPCTDVRENIPPSLTLGDDAAPIPLPSAVLAEFDPATQQGPPLQPKQRDPTAPCVSPLPSPAVFPSSGSSGGRERPPRGEMGPPPFPPLVGRGDQAKPGGWEPYALNH